MEMNPGVLHRPGRVPKQELLVPRSLLEMTAEIGNSSGKRDCISRVFATRVKIRAKGESEAVSRGSRRVPGAAYP